jgi:uncharacterized protein (DUF58 family)
VLHTLERATARGTAGGTEAVPAITQLLPRTGITVFLSDWYAEPDRARETLGEVRVRGHDVIAFHLVDPAERSFPYDDPAAFEDLETGQRLSVVPETLRGRYQSLLADHYAGLERNFGRAGVDYCRVETSQPLDLVLYEYLSRREALARVR